MLRDCLACGLELIGDFPRGQLLLVHEAQDRDALRLTESLEHFVKALWTFLSRSHAYCARTANAANARHYLGANSKCKPCAANLLRKPMLAHGWLFRYL